MICETSEFEKLEKTGCNVLGYTHRVKVNTHYKSLLFTECRRGLEPQLQL